jgi:superfamily II DNA or RNA helicase
MLFDQLWPKQVEAAEFLLANDCAALFAEQGTGKTWITSAVIEKLADRRFSALAVVPFSNLVSSWERKLTEINGLNICRDWDELKGTDCPKILLLHYEAVSPRRKKRGRPTPNSRKLAEKVIKYPWSLVVFDESQRLKSRNSAASRMAGRIRQADRRVILSGTPFDDLLDDPQELWAQFRFVAPQVFGRRWGGYDANYLRPAGYMGYKRAFRKTALPIVLKKVEPYCMRLKKEEVIPNLPPMTHHRVPVMMLGSQRQLYDEMERDMVTEISGKDVTAGLRITQLVKLQQITGGWVKDDDGEFHPVGRAKIRKIRSMLQKIKPPLVIFAKYKTEVAQIASEARRVYEHVSTIEGRNRRTRTETIDAFQSGSIDVLVAQIRTGGVGIDLQRACTAIIYSTTYSQIDFEQAMSRLHRGGQERAVKIYLLYAKDTVDNEIYQALLLKRSVSEAVLQRFRKHLNAGGLTMARKTTKDKVKDANKKTEKKEKAPTTKYGIKDLAEMLGITPASTRVKLRTHKVEKRGGRYGWDTKAELQEVADKVKSTKDEDGDGE